MISDIFLLFSDALTGTTSAASTDYLDNKAAKGNMNEPGAKIVITVDTAFTAVSGAPTNTFQLQTADDSDFISGAPITLAQTAALVAADLVAGAKFTIDVPNNGLKRYVRIYKSAGTTTAGNVIWSAGAYTAVGVLDSDVLNKLA